MRILLDSCVSGWAKRALVDLGCDVVWTMDWGHDPGDAAILAWAFANNRVLVTLDKDFGELAIVHLAPHCGIVRLVDVAAREQGPLVHRLIGEYGDQLAAGAIVTAESERIRIRMPDAT